jgi:hypothetical protein
MPDTQTGSSRHLNAYHKSEPLLLQFLLTEFIQVYYQFTSIKNLIDEEQFNNSLFALLSRLSASSYEIKNTIFRNHENSSLSKLYFYASYLSEYVQLHSFPPLAKSCQKCWALGARLVEAMESRQLEMVSNIIKKLHSTLRQTAKEIVKVIALFRNNENVLYFILRHRAQLDAILGHNFILKLLSNIFPNGLVGVRNFLVEKYNDRGFDKLSETISQTFNAIL